MPDFVQSFRADYRTPIQRTSALSVLGPEAIVWFEEWPQATHPLKQAPGWSNDRHD